MKEFEAPYTYNSASLMQNFDNKIIIGKKSGNVNRTCDELT